MLVYQTADPVYQGDRTFSIAELDSYIGAALGSGTGVPSKFSGTRGLTGGTKNAVPQYIQTRTAANGTPILAIQPSGAANGGVRQINTAVQAVATFSTFNFNPYNLFQTPFERFNIYGAANYRVTDGIEV